MSRLKLLFAMTLVLAACTQNPIPGDGRVVQREPPKPPPVVPPLILDLPESIDTLEGAKVEFTVGASVPAPGQPVVAILGLPPGATYDAATRLFSWTPGFEAANDPRDPKTILRTYPLKFSLSSSEDPVTVTSRSTLLIVRDVARDVQLPLPAVPVEVFEGAQLSQDVVVQSPDYPKGPFELQIENMPIGMEIHRDLTNGAKFTIKYKPSFREVDILKNASSTVRPSVDKILGLTAYGPRGINVSGKLTVRVVDVRQNAIMMLPPKISPGTTVSFSFNSEDPNGEVPPTVTLAPRPSFGLSEIVPTTNAGDPARGVNPSTTVNFRWAQIPPDKFGTTQEVNFRSCVQRTRWDKSFCTDKKMTVKFEQELHANPVIDRTSFPLGTVKYVKEQERLVIPVRVRDGEFSTTAPTVKVTPVSDEVKWLQGNLEINGKKAGLKQISLTATSVFGMQTVENFLVEVLPWSWKSVLLFGESPLDPEVKSSASLFEEAQVANPVLQLTDPRLTVLRKTVFIGTSALNEKTVIAPMEKLASEIGDVVISTPLLNSLEGVLKTEIDDLNIVVGNRITDLTGYTLEVASGSGLTPPSDPIKLNTALTRESAQPAPVEYDGGLFGSACKTLLVLKKAGQDDIPVALSCSRKNGRLIVAGFEFADIQTSPNDSTLVKKWLKTLVKQ